jgi:hypothetical protein
MRQISSATSAAVMALPSPAMPAVAYHIGGAAGVGLARLYCLVLGAALLFPITLPGTGGIRTTDAVNLLCAASLAVDLVLNRPFHRSVRTLGMVLLLSFSWLALEFVVGSGPDSDPRLSIMLFRWLCSLFTAYWLASRMSDPRLRPWIAAGMILGASITLGMLIYDPQSGDPNAPHQVDQPVWQGDQIRGYGIFTHPNAASPAILFLVPLILGLIAEGYLSIVAIAAIPVASYFVLDITQTRSTAMITVLLCALLVYRRVRSKQMFWLVAGAAAFVGALIWLAIMSATPLQPGESDELIGRLLNSREAASNADGRLMTMVASLQLLLEHPLGLGSTYIRPLMELAQGYDTPHNALLGMALLGGVPLTGFIAWRMLRTAAGLVADAPIEAWCAMYLVAAFQFEILLSQPMMMVLCLWTMCGAPKRADP